MRIKKLFYFVCVINLTALLSPIVCAENIDPDNDGSQYAYADKHIKVEVLIMT